MEINYIILAHKNPSQLKRLIIGLNSSNTNFYIHIDRNVDITNFTSKIKTTSNIRFLKGEQRKPGLWGDIEIVKGVFEAIKLILRDGRKGYSCLLSGQDFPLKSNQDISAFLEANYPIHFMDFYQTPGNWNGHIRDRISRYKINKSNKKGHFLLLPSIYDKDFYQFETLGKLNYLRKSGKLKEAKVIFNKRIYPENFNPYGGSVYWALPTATLEKLMKIINENPDFLAFHKYSLCADEIVFQSLLKKLMESEPIEIQPSLTYVNWSKKSGPLPVTFESDDYLELVKASENKLFARKFDIKKDQFILDRIDKLRNT